jgi:hypothetical protein
VVLGLGLPLVMVAIATLIQRVTPQALVGRVSTASNAMFSLPQTLSIGLGAVLVQFVDFRLLFVVIAAVLTASAGYFWAGRSLTTAPAPLHTDSPTLV